MSSLVQVRYKIRFKPKGWSPFKRAWKWNPIAARWEHAGWSTRYRTVFYDPSAKRVAVTPTPNGRSLLGPLEMERVREVARKRRWDLEVERITVPRFKHLIGDLDCEDSLLARLDRVGAELGKTILVRSGRRTLAEQQQLYDTLGPAIAAFPSPNAPHVRGIAADCGIDGVNIGAYPGARDAMKKYGLCLRVPGENWHVEKGDTWNA